MLSVGVGMLLVWAAIIEEGNVVGQTSYCEKLNSVREYNKALEKQTCTKTVSYEVGDGIWWTRKEVVHVFD